MRRTIISLLGSISIIILIIFTQYMYGNLKGHDMIFHIVRLDGLIQAAKENTVLLYIDSSLISGYGYATKLFYSDFLLIPFGYLGKYTDITTTYTLLNITMSLACAGISYLSVRKIGLNKFIAYCFTLLYTFSIYRLYNVYDRNALGESLAMTFAPLILWGYYEIIYNNYKKWYILSIGYSLIMLSHVLSTLIFALAGGIILIINIKHLLKENIRIKYFLIASLVSIILSSHSLFPLLEQLTSNRFHLHINKVFVTEDLKYIVRGFFSGISYVLVPDIGIGLIITILLLSRVFLKRNPLIKSTDKLILFCLPIYFMISPYFFWGRFPFDKLEIIQFTFRLYLIIVPLTALAASIYFHNNFKYKNTKNSLFGILIIITLISMQIISTSTRGKLFKSDILLEQIVKSKNEEFQFSVSNAEYLPVKVPNLDFFRQRANDSIRIVSGTNNIDGFKRGKRNIEATTTNSEATTIELPLIYYKGYKAHINNHDVKVNESDYGLIQLDIQEKGTINVFFGGTIIQKVSPYITIFSFIILFIYIYFYNRKKKKEDN